MTVECDRGELLRKLRVELAELELQLEAYQSGDMRLVDIGMRGLRVGQDAGQGLFSPPPTARSDSSASREGRWRAHPSRYWIAHSEQQ